MLNLQNLGFKEIYHSLNSLHYKSDNLRVELSKNYIIFTNTSIYKPVFLTYPILKAFYDKFLELYNPISKILKITSNKSGSGSISRRITLPSQILDDMGLSLEDKNISLIYNPISKEIILKKC